MSKKSCINCAWFCHADRKCYGTPFMLEGLEVGAVLTEAPEEGCCRDWAFDGLEDWEREPADALVTMEYESCL